MPTKKVRKKSSPKPRSKKIDNCLVAAQHFGFEPISEPKPNKEDKEKANKIRKGNTFTHSLLPSIEEIVALLDSVAEKMKKKSASDPLMIYYCSKTSPKSKKQRAEKVASLHCIGTSKTIAEAILIKSALSILEENGYKELIVEINHIGGKESMSKFFRELTSYYRKHLGDMNAHCRQLMKDSVHSLCLCQNELDEEIVDNAPSPLSFLTDTNRDQFKEIIEYLEKYDVPYVIEKNALGDPNYSSHTIFSIIDSKSGKMVAAGSRYNHVSKKVGYRKDTPAIFVTIKTAGSKKVPASRLPKKEKMKFFFMQIGPQAKMESLRILDILRKSHIPIHKSLSRDKLSTQLQYANRLKVTHLIIVGQKEAISDSVVVRDTATHKQTTVPVDELVTYLKSLK